VADGLAYAHSQGIIHRDIKPENILLQSGHAVIADFGIARALYAAGVDEVSSARFVLGTPAYMSPEQTTGGDPVDQRSDVYSLGCVLYEMVGGQPPFTGPSPMALAAMHRHQEPAPLQSLRPDVPNWIQTVADRALAKRPEDRFQSAGALGEALAAQAVKTRPFTRKKLIKASRWVGLAAAGMAALGLLFDYQFRRPTTTLASSETHATGPRDPTHLAVLYFDDRSRDSSLQTVAKGLTEDLIDQLVQVEALTVISANGVRPYRDQAVSPDSLAAALSVGSLVTGSVTGTADRPRVTVRLIDAPTGRQLDSKVIEAGGGDVLSLRGELSQEVARFLRQRLGQEIKLRELRSGTRDIKAWLLMRRVEDMREDARTLFSSGDVAAARRILRSGDSLLAVVERRDPRWPDPIVLRGWLAADQIEMSDTSPAVTLARWVPIGLGHAERALAQRPGYPPALEVRGYLRFTGWFYSDQTALAGAEAAERDLRAAAVPENPHQARAWSMLSYLLLTRGALAEANLAARRAYDADAFLEDAPAVVFRLYLTSLMSTRWAEAEDWCRQGYRRFPGHWLFTYCQLSLLAESGARSPDVAEAWRLDAGLARLVAPSERAQLAPRWRMLVASVLARAGLSDSSRRVLRAAQLKGAGDQELDYYEAGVRMRLRQPQEALALLRRYLRNSPTSRAFVREDPTFRPLRSDPDFQALVNQPD
jgi:serine/threonine-protein kinase